ncbi:hypothetical protein SLS58_010196 [Diplodia intermedia]|uniref:Uncharacterized protein n=1 Tax=Diplodia intermedia TaxID=856260 RepID=A0ABR3T7G8_9PEZI
MRVNLGQIRHQESDKVYELHNDGYDRQLLSEFSVNSPCERSPTWQISEPAHTQSCADLVRKMYGPDPQVSFNDPFSATIYVRRFVLSVWEEWMSQELADIHDGELADLRKHRGSNAFEHHEGEDSKIITDYQRMVDISHNIRLHKRAAKAIGWAFCNDAKDNKRSDGEEERRAWSILEEKLSLLEAQLGEWMGMFAQRASMAEALEANRQARSAGQLTKLATVAVPCSIVAAVFSMGGDFAAGKPLFPVFWVITLPVTFVLLLWVIHGNTIMAWWKARGKQKPQRKGREVQRAWNVLGWKLSLNVSAQPDEEKGK